jgi:hypothetical protein
LVHGTTIAVRRTAPNPEKQVPDSWNNSDPGTELSTAARFPAVITTAWSDHDSPAAKTVAGILPVGDTSGSVDAEPRDMLEVFWAVHLKVTALGEELAEQPVRVLIRAALPRAARIGEVDALREVSRRQVA